MVAKILNAFPTELFSGLTIFLICDDTHTTIGLVVKSKLKLKDNTRSKIFGRVMFEMRGVT